MKDIILMTEWEKNVIICTTGVTTSKNNWKLSWKHFFKNSPKTLEYYGLQE